MLLAMRSEITSNGSRVGSQTLLIRQRKITRTGGGVSSRRLLAIRSRLTSGPHQFVAVKT